MTTLDPTLARLFVHPITIERREVREDSAGGQIVRWRTVGETLGRISSPTISTPTEIRIALSGETSVPYYAYVPPDTDIRRGDRLDDGDRKHSVTSVTVFSVRAYLRAECSEYQEEIPSRAPTESEE